MKTEILIIGSGPSGSSVAYKCAEAGKKVVVVDSLFGGVCALRGCTPKKAMESITTTFWEAKKMEKAGFPSSSKYVDWHKLVAHQAKFTAMVPAKTKAKFETAGIKCITGVASFEDSHTVLVNDKKITADKIIIATGAQPRPLNIPGEAYLITNDGFFSLDKLPEKIVIVGGGYIAFELSHIMAACAAKVTILGNEEQALGAFDSELVNDLVYATLDKGVDVKLGYEVEKIIKKNNEFEVSAKRTDGQDFAFEADLVIHAAGRVPNIAKLKVDKIGLTLNDKNGIEVTKFLQTKKHEHIFALGDATGQLPFTEVANYEAKIVINNILEKRRKSVDYSGVPYGVFTHPKLAMVGKSEQELKDAKIKYDVKTETINHDFIQRTKLNKYARYKTLVDKKTRKILGASMLAYGADEIINLYSLAIQNEMTADELNDIFLLYPTAGHVVKFLF